MMIRISRTGFQNITHSIEFNPQKLINEKKLAEVNVKRVEESSEPNFPTIITASVIRQTSVTSPPYKVKLELNNNRHVIKRSCTCVSQAAGKCKHIYAVIHYINNDRSESKTSAEQGWGKPSDVQLGKEMYSKPLAITDDFPSTREHGPVYNVQYCDLSEINCPFRSILKYESETAIQTAARVFVNDLCNLAIEMIAERQSERFFKNLLEISRQSGYYTYDITFTDRELYDYYNQNIKLYNNQIIKLCLSTINQSENPEWFSARHIRLSASSKAHSIKTMKKKNAQTLAYDLINLKSNSNPTKSMEYGLKNEQKAICEYSLKLSVDVIPVGLLVKPLQSWLCASLDGLVVKNNEIIKILEIKCPSTCASKPVFDQKTGKFNVGYLYMANGQGFLKKSNLYYTQCQILMYVSGLNICDFYVWSPKGSYLISVIRDEMFLKKLIPTMKFFYFTYYLKQLLKNDQEKAAS